MSSCLHLALNGKFKPGAEEALQKLGAQLHETLTEQIKDAQMGRADEVSANFALRELQEDNKNMKLELEKMSASVAHAESECIALKADRDALAKEAARAAEQLSEMESIRLALEESKREADANVAILGSEVTSLKESNATLLENVQELREKEIDLSATIQASREEMVVLQQAADGHAELGENVDVLNEQLATKDSELTDLRRILENKNEEITCLTTELDEQLVDIDKLNDDATRLSLELKSTRCQLQETEAEATRLNEQLEEAAQEKALSQESLNQAIAEKGSAIEEKDALEAKMRYAKGQFDKMKNLLAERGKQLAELKDENQRAKADIDRLNMQLSNEEGQTNEEHSGHIMRLESEMQSIRDSLEVSNAERHSLQAQLTDTSSQLAASEAQLESIRAELEASMDSTHAAIAERDAFEDTIRLLQEDVQVLQDERDNSSSLHSQLEASIGQLTHELEERGAALDRSSEHITSLEGRLQDLSGIENDLRETKLALEKSVNDAQHLMDIVTERDNQLARQTKELEDLNAQLLELPQVHQSLADSQAQMGDLLPQYHALQQELSDARVEITKLETRSCAADQMQQELQGVHKALADAKNENVHLQDMLKASEASSLHKDTSINRLTADLEEACSFAELAESETQQAVEKTRKMEGDIREMQLVLSEVQEQLSAKNQELSSLEEEVARSRASLESHTKTELELQSTKVRFGVCEQELQNLRQEIQHHKAASSRLSETELALASVESDKSTLEKQLDECRLTIEQLSSTEEQLQTKDQQLTEANAQISSLQQKIADSNAFINRLQVEQEQGSASIKSFELASQRMQDQLLILQEEVAQNQNRDEEVLGLRQQVMQLETALAISGSQAALPSVNTSEQYNSPGPNLARPSEHDHEVLNGTSESVLRTEVSSLNNQLVEAHNRETSLLEEIFGLRNELENKRSLRNEAHVILDEPPPSLPGSVMVNMDGITNKKDEDIHDIEATVLSGGDTSGFQPIAGLIRGTIAMQYLKPCIQGSDFIDRGFIVLMRQPALRLMLLTYFMLLHIVAFLFGAT